MANMEEMNVHSIETNLLKIIPSTIEPPTSTGRTYYTKGHFTYYHYGCDGSNDVGWGCAYRTLQSMCSWLTSTNQLSAPSVPHVAVPSIKKIQQTLVDISDKPASFLNSHEWIGALEVFYVIDVLYDIPCKIQHIPSSQDIRKFSNIFKSYFEDYGGFVMMGGDVDAASKGVVGIHVAENDAYFLVVDPHYVGCTTSVECLINKGYIRWQNSADFEDSSFYNVCLPLQKYETNGHHR